MQMIGHKTESIDRRYTIVDEKAHREAAAKIGAWRAEQKNEGQGAGSRLQEAG
jgi:hypothetical protein